MTQNYYQHNEFYELVAIFGTNLHSILHRTTFRPWHSNKQQQQ